MDLVKRECEDILKQTRESAEKQFHEIVELYNETREKVFGGKKFSKSFASIAVTIAMKLNFWNRNSRGGKN